MTENPDESLWIHADDPGNIFQLQDIFGLHPLAVDAIVHRHQPSKIEEYDRYVFTIVDGVRYEEQENIKVKGREESDKGNNDMFANSDLEEDDLYIFLERRWIITINFYNHQLQSNIKQRISRSLLSSHESPLPLSEQHRRQQRSSSSAEKGKSMDYSMGICEMVYRFAIEEIISCYYPVIDKINIQLEQIEDYVILEKPTNSQLINVLLIRRKISRLEGSFPT
jgi:Mg2+ and Co2+ transporter CorA